MINVTKTYLPNKEKYHKYVDEIYANGWITNNGPLVKKLEKRLAELKKELKPIKARPEKLKVVVCLNYGGRQEIVQAVKKIREKNEEVNIEAISKNLYRQDEEPQLLIRTGGAYRFSNFLLWSSIYTELYTSDLLLPEFYEWELALMLMRYRDRAIRNEGK